MRIEFTKHALKRCSESNINWHRLYREIRNLPIKGKCRWVTKYGVLILEQVNSSLIIVKTFIAKYKYKGKKFHKGCNTF